MDAARVAGLRSWVGVDHHSGTSVCPPRNVAGALTDQRVNDVETKWEVSSLDPDVKSLVFRRIESYGRRFVLPKLTLAAPAGEP